MSNIDPLVPAEGNATTESVRTNFITAKAEIEDLNDRVTALELGGGSDGGGGMPDVPADGNAYGLQDTEWVAVLPLSGGAVSGDLGVTGNLDVAGMTSLMGAVTIADPLTVETGIVGVIDGSDAASGQVGEFLFVLLPTSDGVPLISNVVRDVLTLDLPPGDWDVQGAVNTTGSTSTMSDIMVWIGTASSTRPSTDDKARFAVCEINFGTGGQSGANANTQLMTGMVRQSSALPVTIYLSCVITWNSGTVAASGAIRARRMR